MVDELTDRRAGQWWLVIACGGDASRVHQNKLHLSRKKTASLLPRHSHLTKVYTTPVGFP